MLVPALFAAGSWAAYRASLAAAANYGVVVTSAIDVFRLRLIKEMGLALPVDTDAERSIHENLTQLWSGGLNSKKIKLTNAITDQDFGIRVDHRQASTSDEDPA
ncbi:hypothetical protein [Cryptosporangium arvum]|nr:hypothetical protein [Cryptosporangium arvum]